MLALIAGQGALPGLIVDRHRPEIVCELESAPSGLPGAEPFRIETLGTLLASLRDRGATEVCFAGAIRRPRLDPALVDAETMPLVPRMLAALGQGDDGALRTVIGIFEDAGQKVRAAHELLPELLPEAGIPTRAAPGSRDEADAVRAATVHSTLSGADLGQACAVAAGQVLAVETLGGTDWMLATLAGDLRPDGGTGGLLYKAPKVGQDRRIDLPTIGPGTVRGAAAARLSGIVVEAGGVLVLDPGGTVAACDEAGLFLWVRAP